MGDDEVLCIVHTSMFATFYCSMAVARKMLIIPKSYVYLNITGECIGRSYFIVVTGDGVRVLLCHCHVCSGVAGGENWRGWVGRYTFSVVRSGVIL